MSSHKVKIVAHGYLKDLCPEITLSGHNVAEVINGLGKQVPALRVANGQERHCIQVMGFETKEAIFAEIPEGVTELHIMPAMIFGGFGGFLKVIIGIIIIAAVVLSAGGFAAAFAATGLTSFALNMGISLVLGGLLEMMSPAPTMTGGQSTKDVEGSKYLGATENTVAIGTRIPLVYGRYKVFGHYLSFDVDAKDVAL